MLLNTILALTTTDTDYKKVLRKRISLCYVILALGLITLVFTGLFSMGKYDYLPDFLSGFYTGIGFALISISLVTMFKIRNIMKDEKKLKEKKLKEQDERNQLIALKSLYSAGITLIIIAYIALLVSGIFNLVVFWTLFIVIQIYVIAFLIMKVYYSRKL